MSRFNEFHRINWERMQAGVFGPPHDKIPLVACIAEEMGELASAVLRVEGEKRRSPSTREGVLDAIADQITYLSLLASSYGCTDLEALLIDTFNMVSDRSNSSHKVG